MYVAYFALLSAVYAALTSILAKVGIGSVNANLATAIRTVVVVVMAWGMIFLTGAQSGMGKIGRRSWGFLILSGVATGASWLCYCRAWCRPLSFCMRNFTARSLVSWALIGIGTLVMVL